MGLWRCEPKVFSVGKCDRPPPVHKYGVLVKLSTSTTIPARSHLVGCGPTRLCSLTQLPITIKVEVEHVCALTVAHVPSCVGHVAHPLLLPVYRAKSSVVDTVQVALE